GIEPADDAPHKNFDKERQEVEIGFSRLEAERVDGEVGGFQSDAKIGASEEPCEALEAAAQVKDERERIVFLEIGNQEVQEEGLSTARPAEDHAVRDIAVMKVQEIR